MSDMAINGSSSPRLATSAFGRNPDIRQLVSFRPGSPQIRGTALWVLRGIGRGRFAPPAPVQREMRQGKGPTYMAGPVVSHAFGLSVGSLRIREGHPFMTNRPVAPQSTPLVPMVKRWPQKAPPLPATGPVAGERGGQAPGFEKNRAACSAVSSRMATIL